MVGCWPVSGPSSLPYPTQLHQPQPAFRPSQDLGPCCSSLSTPYSQLIALLLDLKSPRAAASPANTLSILGVCAHGAGIWPINNCLPCHSMLIFELDFNSIPCSPHLTLPRTPHPLPTNRTLSTQLPNVTSTSANSSSTVSAHCSSSPPYTKSMVTSDAPS